MFLRCTPPGNRRNHEAKTARDAQTFCLISSKRQRDYDRRTGLPWQQTGYRRIERLQQIASHVGRSGQHHRIEPGIQAVLTIGSYPPDGTIRLNAQHWLTQTERRSRQPVNHSMDESLEPMDEGGEDGRRRWLRVSLHRLYQASVLSFHSNEGGHHRPHTELCN